MMNDGNHLFEGDREAGFGRQGIIDANNANARPRRIFAHDAVMRVDAEHHPATAVDIDHGRLIGDTIGIIDPDADGAVRGFHTLLGCREHHRAALNPGGAHLFGHLPGIDDGLLQVAAVGDIGFTGDPDEITDSRIEVCTRMCRRRSKHRWDIL